MNAQNAEKETTTSKRQVISQEHDDSKTSGLDCPIIAAAAAVVAELVVSSRLPSVRHVTF